MAPLGKAVGAPVGKPTGFPAGAPTAPPAATPAGRATNRTAAMVAGGVLLLALVALGAVLLARPGSDGEVSTDGDGDAASSDEGADAGEDAGAAPSDDGDDGSSGSGSGGSDTTTAPPTTQPAVVEVLYPSSVSASNSRADVPQLNCGGSATYGPYNLFDGDANTGWGASDVDGTGQSVTARFDGSVHLTRVGITPGFTKFGERQDQNCRPVSAFRFNHFIAEVLWSFDDGTEVRQTFEQRGTLQFVRVDTTTRSVTMTIRRTELPPGADTDTVISTMEIRGSR